MKANLFDRRVKCSLVALISKIAAFGNEEPTRETIVIFFSRDNETVDENGYRWMFARILCQNHNNSETQNNTKFVCINKRGGF